MIVSEFESKAFLINACIASSQLPFASVTGVGWPFRGDRVLVCAPGGCGIGGWHGVVLFLLRAHVMYTGWWIHKQLPHVS